MALIFSAILFYLVYLLRLLLVYLCHTVSISWERPAEFYLFSLSMQDSGGLDCWIAWQDVTTNHHSMIKHIEVSNLFSYGAS